MNLLRNASFSRLFPASLPFVGLSKRPAAVEDKGFEPLTPCLQSRCSSQLS